MDRDTFAKLSAELTTRLQTRFDEVKPDDVAHPGMEFANKVRDDVLGMAAKRLDADHQKDVFDYALLAALSAWYDRQRDVKRLAQLIANRPGP